MIVLADMPTEEEIEVLYGEFCKLDRSEGDQEQKMTVSVDRILELMITVTEKKDWTDDSVKQLLEESDVSTCDEYEFEDFLQILTCHRTRERNEKLMSTLIEADTDAKGFLSPSTLEEKMRELDESFDENEIKFWIDDSGVNEAGDIDYRQFLENYKPIRWKRKSTTSLMNNLKLNLFESLKEVWN